MCISTCTDLPRPSTRLQLAKDLIATNPLALFNGTHHPTALLPTALLSPQPLTMYPVPSGLLPRCVFFGALIAGQFLLYDDFKRLFKVGSSDIVFYLDVFASTDLSFWPRT